MNKIIKNGKTRIIDDELVYKEDKDNIELFNYLNSRDYKNYLNYVERKNNISTYKYIKDTSIDKYQKGEDLITEVSLLHSKTSFNKEVSEEKNQEIKKNILGYINYLDEYYRNILTEIEFHEFNSPSEQIFLYNYSKLLDLFTFLKDEVNSWYNLVKDKRKTRVCLNHGALSLDHIIVNKNRYLISWDKACFDSPILDLTNLYHNEWNNVDFSSLLEIYLEKCKLSNDELKLLFINLAIPKKLKKYDNEFTNTIEMRYFFDYIFKTENLIRPYYLKQNKEKNEDFNKQDK